MNQKWPTFKKCGETLKIGNIWWWIQVPLKICLFVTSIFKMCRWADLEHVGELIESNPLVLGIINLNMFLITFMKRSLFSLSIHSLQFFPCSLMKLWAIAPCKKWWCIHKHLIHLHRRWDHINLFFFWSFLDHTIENRSQPLCKRISG